MLTVLRHCNRVIAGFIRYYSDVDEYFSGATERTKRREMAVGGCTTARVLQRVARLSP